MELGLEKGREDIRSEELDAERKAIGDDGVDYSSCDYAPQNTKQTLQGDRHSHFSLFLQTMKKKTEYIHS